MPAEATNAINVFFSYANVDENLRKELEKQLSLLKRQNLISSWHDRDIKAGTEWEHEIDSHLNTADIILLLISPDFITSDYCYSVEMKRAIERHKAGEAAVIPILLRPVDWADAPFSKLQALPTNAKPVTRWRNRDEAFLDIAKGIRKCIEVLYIKKTSVGLSLHQPLLNIPYQRNPFFTGRENVLNFLHATFTTSSAAGLTQLQAISGLGGMGKTQTAVEYVYRYYKEYQAVLWATADSHEVLVSDFVNIAELLDLPEKNEQDQSHIVNAIKRWLNNHTDWLMVFDNVEDPEIIEKFIPRTGKGHLLLTTRANVTEPIAQNVELEKMEPDEGALFLLRRTKTITLATSPNDIDETNRNKAREISEVMDSLPLALDQAGAFILETKSSMSRYLDLYKERHSELLRRRGKFPSGHPEPVATTWSLSFDKVKEANPAAAELLNFCAFFYPDNIPEEIFSEGASDLDPVIQSVVSDMFLLEEAIGELLKYSLLRRDSDFQTLSIHRLVQVVLKDTMGKETKRQWEERAVRAVNRVFPEVNSITAFRCQRYIAHAQVLGTLIKQWDEDRIFPEAGQLLNKVGRYLREHAQYTEAEGIFQQALMICKKVLGSDHPETAFSLTNLSWIYYAQGKRALAKEFSQRALEIREKALGQEHPDVADSLNQLAVLYRAERENEKAELLLQRALTIYIHTKGLDHPDTLFGLQNLAALYRTLRKYKLAEQLARQALAIRKEMLGSDHLDTTYSLNQLAEIYYAEGKYDQAEPLYQQALAIREKVLGPDHPNTAYSLTKLARLYQLARYHHVKGKYDQVESFYRRALNIYEQSVGTESLSVARTLSLLADFYCTQGKYDQAEPLYQQALAIFEKVLGPDHPDLTTSLRNYASLLQKMKREEEATRLEARARTIRTKHKYSEENLIQSTGDNFYF